MLLRVFGRTLLVGIIALLSGCLVGPDYAAPGTSERGDLEVAKAADAEKAGIAPGKDVVRDWWTTLNDKTLASLVARALDANLDLRTAMARVRETRAERALAVSGLLPSANVGGFVYDSGSGDRFHSSIDYQGGLNPSTLGFGATWDIDVWGATRRGIESAQATLEATVEARRDVLVTLLSDLGSNYVELRGEQRQLAIAKRNVDLQERTVELVTTRRRTGLASGLQVSQARTQLQSTRAQIPSLESAITKSIHRISVLCGLDCEALLAELGPPGPIPPAPPVVPIGLSSELLKRRPDIRKAERTMQAANAQIGVAFAAYFPQFSLTGNLVYGSINSLGRAGTPSFYGGPTVTWPIFDAFAIAQNVAVQDARLEEAVLTYRQAILLAFEDVANAIDAYAKERVRRDTLVDAEQEAERALDAAQTQYKDGLVDFLNVLDAQQTLATSQQALAVSEETLMTDLIVLYKALGGGWEVFETDLARQELQESNTELPR
jgi:NodT family efflux transporter outer membrane factor (OMF) lipoprotein